MTNADIIRLTTLLRSHAKSTLLIATRLKALEEAMQGEYTSHALWDRYAKQLGWAVNRATQLQQRREPQADQELDETIVRLQHLLNDRE